jgi:hypothetical protein
MAHHDALDAALEAWTRTFEPYDLMMQLQSAGVCQTAGDRCDNDPQLRHLDWLTELTGTRIGRWPLAAGRGPGPDVTHASVSRRPPRPRRPGYARDTDRGGRWRRRQSGGPVGGVGDREWAREGGGAGRGPVGGAVGGVGDGGRRGRGGGATGAYLGGRPDSAALRVRTTW